MGCHYQEKYTVPFYESDINFNMKLPELLSLVLQVSGKQSMALGISNEFIYEKYQLVWIVTDYAIEIERLPKYAETITVETVPTSYNTLFCYRDFYVYDATGAKIITIHSTFVLMDYETRKVHFVIDDLVAPYQAEKIKKIYRGPKYEDLENPEETLYHVRFFDLDLNGHVNNSKYLAWMYEGLDFEFLQHHVPRNIHLKYVKEIHYGHDIISRVEQKDLSTKHEIVTQGTVHAQACIEWRSIEESRL